MSIDTPIITGLRLSFTYLRLSLTHLRLSFTHLRISSTHLRLSDKQQCACRKGLRMSTFY